MVYQNSDQYFDLLTKLKEEAQQQAIERYEKRLREIDEIRSAIALVEKGRLPLVNLDNDANRVRQRIEREHAPMNVAMERINGSNDFQDAMIVDVLSRLKNSVCRISMNGTGIGTGFLVGESVIITNHHVIPDADAAKRMQAEFGYELNQDKQLQRGPASALRPDLFFCSSSINPVEGDETSGLDFTLVALDPAVDLSAYPIAYLDGTLGKVVLGEHCISIQHPAGEPKKIVLKNISLLKFTETHLIYESDTLPGSSGSMVIGLGTGEIIALHHAGVPKRDAQGRVLTKTGAVAYPGTPDDQIDWEGNEGIRVSCIIHAIERFNLPATMEPYREKVLRQTRQRRNENSNREANISATPVSTTPIKPITMTPIANNQQIRVSGTVSESAKMVPFNILVKNIPEHISAVNAFLSGRYGTNIRISMLTPATAIEGADELFTFSATPAASPDDEAAALTRFVYILAAEADLPMALNTTQIGKEAGTAQVYESAVKEQIWEDEFSEWNESEFEERWKGKSAYVKDKRPEDFRRWNHFATRFDLEHKIDFERLKNAGLLIAQLDTGFTRHSKIAGGIDEELDFDAITGDDDATDELQGGILKFPGHGTRTGSILVGRKPLYETDDPLTYHDGNYGLIHQGSGRIIPYRIAETVLLLNRQQELAKAVDRAISSGVQIMTMSMGTAPTVTTARLAKKAYDAGVIWCCAAGNEVKFVVAPAVFPGTIAVAASNPEDAPWPKSSVGDAVDIAAPGQDVYVPIFSKDAAGKTIEDFAYGSGTSYATPHVAAAAALWLAQYRAELSGVQGWRKVEAFRKAVKATARKSDKLPRGYGAGILDLDALLHSEAGKPTPEMIDRLKYAYIGWNENAFLASLQGWTELFKTYWNIAHRGIRKLFGLESVLLETSTAQLTEFSRVQESLLFGSSGTLESAGTITEAESIRRMNILSELILKNSKA